MKNRAIHLFIVLVIACSIALGQYKEENRIVALSKYYLKPLRTVEDGSSEERREVFDEHAKKMRIRDNLLVSSNVLYHYLSGRSDEVVILNEWNNIMDADAALSCLREFDKTACVIVKHASPCGVAEGERLIDVYKYAFNADSLSAFGGIIALNKKCTEDVAKEISDVFVEVVLAPSFDVGAISVFAKKKNLRILEVGRVNRRKNKQLNNIKS